MKFRVEQEQSRGFNAEAKVKLVTQPPRESFRSLSFSRDTLPPVSVQDVFDALPAMARRPTALHRW